MKSRLLTPVGFLMFAALLYTPHTLFLRLQLVQLAAGKLYCYPHYRDTFKRMQGFFQVFG
jgi:hypothetical protein